MTLSTSIRFFIVWAMATLLELPMEVLLTITSYLEPEDLITLVSLNHQYQKVFRSDIIWENLINQSYLFRSYQWDEFLSKRPLDEWITKGGSHYTYCRCVWLKERAVQKLIDDICQWKRCGTCDGGPQELENRIRHVRENNVGYLPFIEREMKRVSSDRRFHTDKTFRVSVDHFKSVMHRRNEDLLRVHVASTLYHQCMEMVMADAYLDLFTKGDDHVKNTTLENCYIIASMFDRSFHDLMKIRHTFTQNVVKEYRKLEGLITTKIDRLILLSKLIEAEFNQWNKKSGGIPRGTDLSALILRFYAGLDLPSPSMFYAVVVRFCELLNIANVKVTQDGIIFKSDNGQTVSLFSYRVNIGVERHIPEITDIKLYDTATEFNDEYSLAASSEFIKPFVNEISWKIYRYSLIILITWQNQKERNKIQFNDSYVTILQGSDKLLKQSIVGLRYVNDDHMGQWKSFLHWSMSNLSQPSINGKNAIELYSKLNPITTEKYDLEASSSELNVFNCKGSRLLLKFANLDPKYKLNEKNGYEVGDIIVKLDLCNALILEIHTLPHQPITFLVLCGNETHIITQDIIINQCKDRWAYLEFLDYDSIGTMFERYDYETVKFIPWQ